MERGGDGKPGLDYVEDVVIGDELKVTKSKVGVSGTVQLTAGTIVYVPTPTADPQGLFLLPLHMVYEKFLLTHDVAPRPSKSKAMAKGHGPRLHIALFVHPQLFVSILALLTIHSLYNRPLTGFRLWRTIRLLYPYLRCCWQRLRRYHSADDIPNIDNVSFQSKRSGRSVVAKSLCDKQGNRKPYRDARRNCSRSTERFAVRDGYHASHGWPVCSSEKL
jgi:hypothetical protein